MKYYILEIQNDNGTYAHLVHTADTRQGAESVYHQVLSYAAISTLTSHSAVLLDSTGARIMGQCYTHQPEPEIPEDETPEPETAE